MFPVDRRAILNDAALRRLIRTALCVTLCAVLLIVATGAAPRARAAENGGSDAPAPEQAAPAREPHAGMDIEPHAGMDIEPPGPLHYQALELAPRDAARADALFKKDGTPLSLCYCAWLRENKAVKEDGSSDSAEAILQRVRERIPAPDGGWRDSPDDWPDAETPLMGMILSTMFHINSRSLDLQVSSTQGK